jgi:pimeloyl-ACP methyl ester carboxylesterase
MEPPNIQWAMTQDLDVAYEEWGPANTEAVILLHGFPDDPRAWDVVAGTLSKADCRVIVPYLRGFGPTRFRCADTMRSGQQGAIGQDVLHLMNALRLPRATLVGYDWGSRAACVAAALWPERVRALVPINGYTIQNIRRSGRPAHPKIEHQFWYQWYFQTERGRLGLETYRKDLCALLWTLWSPNWKYTPEVLERTAASFDNPDFVEVVIHSYRHRCGAAPGAPSLEIIEQQLVGQPPISVPAIVLVGEADPLRSPALTANDSEHFEGYYEQTVVPSAGHFVPREAPDAVCAAVLKLLRRSEAAKSPATN